jgi:hypothetical protein
MVSQACALLTRNMRCSSHLLAALSQWGAASTEQMVLLAASVLVISRLQEQPL